MTIIRDQLRIKKIKIKHFGFRSHINRTPFELQIEFIVFTWDTRVDDVVDNFRTKWRTFKEENQSIPNYYKTEKNNILKPAGGTGNLKI